MPAVGRTPEQNQPVYWFLILDAAVWNDDHDSAIRATEELERLGVRVEYLRRRAEPRKAKAVRHGK